jgi:hypothetical protein
VEDRVVVVVVVLVVDREQDEIAVLLVAMEVAQPPTENRKKHETPKRVRLAPRFKNERTKSIPEDGFMA